MPDWLNTFIMTFVPLFIVIDALGNLPFIISLTEGMPRREQRKVIHVGILTATVVGLVFLFFGRFVLEVLSISVGSFAIAGGLILLVLSMKYMTTGRMIDVVKQEMIAIVPIGTPLLSGPAAVATLLLLAGQFPVYMVLISFILNLLTAWLFFLAGTRIIGFLGEGGLKAVSNVFNLLLAAIGVSMIFRGLDMLGILDLAA